MKKLFSLICVLTLVFAFSANALDFKEARAQGLVAEQPDGYVKAVKQTTEIDAIVKDVNTRRKQEYERISKENGQSVDIVAKLAAEQIKKSLEK